MISVSKRWWRLADKERYPWSRGADPGIEIALNFLGAGTHRVESHPPWRKRLLDLMETLTQYHAGWPFGGSGAVNLRTQIEVHTEDRHVFPGAVRQRGGSSSRFCAARRRPILERDARLVLRHGQQLRVPPDVETNLECRFAG